MTIDEPSRQHSADRENPGPGRNGRMSLYAWLIIALSAVGIAIYLVVDHWPHVLAALPYLGIIALAAMHLFGHRGHGGGHNGRREAARGTGGDPGDRP